VPVLVSAHTWLTIGILAALPFILGIVLWRWGAEEHDNGYVHTSGEDEPGSDDEGVALAARRAA
jgi:hypothetical protein